MTVESVYQSDLMSLLVMLFVELTYVFVSDPGGGLRGPPWLGSS